MTQLGVVSPFLDPEAWMVIGFLAMLIGFPILLWLFQHFEWKIRRAIVIGEVVIAVGYIAGLFIIYDPDRNLGVKPDLNHPVLEVDAGQLVQTVFTPYLEHGLDGDRNVLWCATIAFAWDELEKLNRGPIHFRNHSVAVERMNQQKIDRAVIDEDAVIALAGSNSAELRNRIAAELERKFGDRADPALLDDLKELPLLVYAYLLKDLPYQWAFERLPGGTFQGKSIASFGIHQYSSAEKNEALAASQVKVYDYRGRDDFILVLAPAAKNDRIVIAKIPPEPTLRETIETVNRRIGNTQPETIPEMGNLAIPILDFDLRKRFAELQGGTMVSDNPQLNGRSLEAVIQRIRFKLDERGAKVESEVAMLEGIGDNLVVDKPFLIFLQQKDQRLPYFAGWIANTELLIPVPAEGSGR